MKGGGPKVNNFEQVSNVGHQISVAGAGARGSNVPYPGGTGLGPGPGLRERGLYSEVQ